MSDDLDFDLIWHEPTRPATGKWAKRLERFVELLRARPGEWGELPPLDDSGYPQSMVTTLRGRWGDDPTLEFRALSLPGRSTTGRVRVFGRYMPQLRAVDGDDDPKGESA